jgi:hypothetical protein
MTIAELLREGPVAINVGVRDLKDQNVDVVELDWSPPRPNDVEMRRLLEKLL